MAKPNVFDYIEQNTITIQTVRDLCQEESDGLQRDIIDAVQEVGKASELSQEIVPLTQNITRAMGDYWFSIDGTIPPGGLPHLGHLVSRTTYSDFYSWLTASKTIMTDEEWLAYAEANGGCCPYYSSGDGSTTFRTPKYDNAFLKTISSINGAGVYEADGLPNITGETGYRTTSDVNYHNTINGAFIHHTGDSRYALAWGSGQTNQAYPLITFDASQSNPIYGNSQSVTPKNISFMIGVYAVGAIVPVGTTDAEKIMSGITRVEGLLDSKLDKSGGVYIVESFSDESVWYRVYSDGWIEQGGLIGAVNAAWVEYIVTFPKPFVTANYTALCAVGHTANTDNGCIKAKLNTSVTFAKIYNSTGLANWYACGY